MIRYFLKSNSFEIALVFAITLTSLSGKSFAQTTPEVVTRSTAELKKAMIRWRKPSYSEAARATGAGGPVVVQLSIDERGRVKRVLIVSGDALLHAPMYYAARRWRFKPSRIEGK